MIVAELVDLPLPREWRQARTTKRWLSVRMWGPTLFHAVGKFDSPLRHLLV